MRGNLQLPVNLSSRYDTTVEGARYILSQVATVLEPYRVTSSSSLDKVFQSFIPSSEGFEKEYKAALNSHKRSSEMLFEIIDKYQKIGVPLVDISSIVGYNVRKKHWKADGKQYLSQGE